MWLFPLYLKNEAEQKVGHGKSFPATCDFRGLGRYPRRLLLEDTGWRGTHPEKGKVLPPGGSDQSRDGHSRRQGRCVCAHKSSCFCLGGGGGGRGLSWVTCICNLQPCAQSEHVVVLSPSLALGVSQCWVHSFLSVTSMFRALGCDRL